MFGEREKEAYHIIGNRTEYICDDTSVFLESQTVVFLNHQTRKQTFLEIPQYHSVTAFSIQHNPYGATSGLGSSSLLAVALSPPAVHVYSFPRKQLVTSLPLTDAGAIVHIRAISISRDGKYVIIATTSVNPQLIYFDLHARTILARRKCIENIHTLSFNPFCGNQIVAYSQNDAAIYSITSNSTLLHPLIIERTLAKTQLESTRQYKSHCWVSETQLLMSTGTPQIIMFTSPTSIPANSTSPVPIDLPNATGQDDRKSIFQRPIHAKPLSILAPSPLNPSVSLSSESAPPLQSLHTPQQTVTTAQLYALGIESNSDGISSASYENETVESALQGVLILSDLPQAPVISQDGSTSESECTAIITSMILSKTHVIVGTDDGTLLWISTTSFKVGYLLRLDNSSGILSLSISPTFSTFSALTRRGHFQILRPLSGGNRTEALNSIDMASDALSQWYDLENPKRTLIAGTPDVRPASAASERTPLFECTSLGHYPVASLTQNTKGKVKTHGSRVIHYRDENGVHPRAITWNSRSTLQLWDLESHALLSTYIFRSSVTCTASSIDGLTMACGLESGVLAIVSCVDLDFRVVYAHRLHSGPVIAVAFSKDNELLTSMGKTKLFFMRASDFKVLGYARHMEYLNPSYSTAISKKNLSEAIERNDPDVDFPISLCWLSAPYPDPKIPLLNMVALITEKGKTLQLIAPSAQASLSELLLNKMIIKPHLHEWDSKPTSITSSEDGKICYSAHVDKGIRRWEFSTEDAGELKCTGEWYMHEKSVASISHAISASVLVTAGEDGIVLIWDSKKMNILKSFHAFSAAAGGCISTSLMANGMYAMASGVDGSFTTFTIPEADSLIIPDLISPEALQSQMKLRREVLNELPTVDEPLASSPSFLSKFASQNSAEKNVALEKRAALAHQVLVVKEQLTLLLRQHNALPEADQFDPIDLAMDLELREKLLQKSAENVKQTKENLNKELIGLEYLAHGIKELCWDGMRIKGEKIKSFKHPLEVTNFPVRVLSTDEKRMRKRIRFLRQMQVQENEYIAQFGLNVDHTSFIARNAPYIISGCEIAQDSSIQAAEKKPTNPTLQNNVESLLYHSLELCTPLRQRIQCMLLHMKVESIEIGFNQLFSEAQAAKNRELEIIMEKTNRMQEIRDELKENIYIWQPMLHPEERNESILKVEDYELPNADGTSSQKTTHRRTAADAMRERGLKTMMNGTLDYKRDLSVLEQEIKSEEWMSMPVERMSDEQRVEFDRWKAKVQRIEFEKQARREALHEEFDKLKESVEQIVYAFDTKLALVYEGRLTKQRDVNIFEWMIIRTKMRLANAEEEANKAKEHQNEVQRWQARHDRCTGLIAITKADLDRMKSLFENVNNEARNLEKIIKKAMSDKGENYDHMLKIYRARKWKGKHHLRSRHQRQTHGYSRANMSMANISVGHQFNVPQHGSHQMNPRKSVFAGGMSGVHGSSALSSLPEENFAFARRRQRSIGNASELRDYALTNPYPQLGAENEEEEGDVETTPPDMTAESWLRFLERRKQIAEKESECHRYQAQVTELQRHLAQLQSADLTILMKIRDLTAVLANYKENAIRQQLNVEAMIRIIQGNVEIPVNEIGEPSSLINDSISLNMIHRGLVEKANEKIVTLGDEKLELMREAMRTRSLITLLHWNIRVLSLEYDDNVDVTRQLQLTRVTRPLQKWIAMGGRQGVAAADGVRLEHQLEFVNKVSREKGTDNATSLQKLQRQLRRLQKDNYSLQEKIVQITKDVTERNNIVSVHVAAEEEKETENDRQMKAAAKQRRYIDLAKVQCAELTYLRKQVTALRKATFASFAPPDQPSYEDNVTIRTTSDILRSVRAQRKHDSECKEEGTRLAIVKRR